MQFSSGRRKATCSSLLIKKCTRATDTCKLNWVVVTHNHGLIKLQCNVCIVGESTTGLVFQKRFWSFWNYILTSVSKQISLHLWFRVRCAHRHPDFTLAYLPAPKLENEGSKREWRHLLWHIRTCIVIGKLKLASTNEAATLTLILHYVWIQPVSPMSHKTLLLYSFTEIISEAHPWRSIVWSNKKVSFRIKILTSKHLLLLKWSSSTDSLSEQWTYCFHLVT